VMAGGGDNSAEMATEADGTSYGAGALVGGSKAESESLTAEAVSLVE